MINNEKEKLVLIDPWCDCSTGGIFSYDSGFIDGMSQNLSVFFFCDYACKDLKLPCEIMPLFFENKKRYKGIILKIYKLLSYVHAYKKVLKFCKKNNIKYVHIMWSLVPFFDYKFVRKFKKRGTKVIYTAHNAIPHDSKPSKCLFKYYHLVDLIVVHGTFIKKELLSYDKTILDNKVFLSKHGTYFNQITNADNDIEISNLFKNNHNYKYLLLFGNGFYNKGFDRIVSNLDKIQDNKVKIIIAGKMSSNYSELLNNKNINDNKIILLNRIITDDEVAYLFNISSVIVLPYRHASMSGVVFTCANMRKLLVTTNVGSIPEYLEDGVDSFVVDNDDNSIVDAINKAFCLNKEEMAEFGKRLYENIETKCNWKLICKDLFENGYQKL